jgi:hypothetical protein
VSIYFQTPGIDADAIVQKLSRLPNSTSSNSPKIEDQFLQKILAQKKKISTFKVSRKSPDHELLKTPTTFENLNLQLLAKDKEIE